MHSFEGEEERRMEVGERWAYRAAPHHGPVEEVEVLKIGSQRPLRIKVRFVSEEAEGREEWVPSARLRIRWQNKDTWLARDKRWNELTQDGPDAEDTAFHAITTLYDEHLWDGVVSFGLNLRDRGVLYIEDMAALKTLLDVPESFFHTDPRTFTDSDGVVIAPWPTTLEVARRLARTQADHLVTLLDEQDRKAQSAAIYGHHYRGRGKNPGTYISPEICAETDRHFKPSRDLLREWCGAEAVESIEELKALREEVLRIGQLMEQAIGCLRHAGQTKAADRLERELGIPLETLRQAERDD
ncbi:hypothetical protein [Streptomyces sp. Rer75]|uniref:hypothetical protein n=1 Tax=Streptomyces sp. Rer75 TaxID=2750011 RepID=UPI0015CFCBC2|nr:hypothetical protein [Streptomyces sp. Rer75]QLH19307.1 hypothetical protein HYQ63_00175 [Streptomyces sp. Rer75]